MEIIVRDSPTAFFFHNKCVIGVNLVISSILSINAVQHKAGVSVEVAESGCGYYCLYVSQCKALR